MMEDNLPVPSKAEGPVPNQEAPPEAPTAPMKTEPVAPSPPPPLPPPTAPPVAVPKPETAPEPPTPKKPTTLTPLPEKPSVPPPLEKEVPPPTPPTTPPPPTISFGRAVKAPMGGPAKARQLLKLLSVLLIVILVGVLGFSLLGFDPSQIPFLGRIFPQPRKEVTLTYWGLWENPDLLNPLFSDFISAYAEEHPNVSLTINYEKRTFGTLEQLKTTLLTRLQQGTAPDLLRLHNSWIKEFVGELAPLPAEVLSEDDYTSTFYPVALSSAKVGEQIYAIPLEYDGLVLYYNKDLLKDVDVSSALSTWEGFRREAVKLTQWGEDDPKGKILKAGAAFGAANNISHSADLLSLLLSQSGVDPLTGLKTQAAADALTYYTNFVTKDHIWDETLPFSIDAFANGQAAMVFGPSWRALNIRDRNPQLNFAAVSIPQLPAAQEEGIHWATFWVEAVSKDSENAEIAWQLLKFLAEEEQQRKFYSAASQVRYFGEPYSRPSLAESLKTHEILGPFLTSAPTAVSGKTVDFSGNKAYVDAFKQAIADVLGGKAADKALETAQATINQLEGITPPPSE